MVFFPESPRETYISNPLKEVICQLRFPTILKITTEIPASFQDGIRTRYPVYTGESSTATLPKEISDLLAGLPLPMNVQQAPVHKFAIEDGTRFISLNQNFLALTEKKYQQWRYFRQEMEIAEAAFRRICEPSFYERIGLRYQNVIDRQALGLERYPWGDLLNRSLIGLLGVGEDADKVAQIRTQSLVRLPETFGGFVLIRHGLVKNDEGLVYVIDSDFFAEERRNPDHVFQTLDGFNQLAARFFRWAITPTLREALGPNPIE